MCAGHSRQARNGASIAKIMLRPIRDRIRVQKDALPRRYRVRSTSCREALLVATMLRSKAERFRRARRRWIGFPKRARQTLQVTSEKTSVTCGSSCNPLIGHASEKCVCMVMVLLTLIALSKVMADETVTKDTNPEGSSSKRIKQKRNLGRVTGLFEMASKPQEANVTLEGEGDHAMLCIRVLHSRSVYRQLLSEVAHSLVEKQIVQEVQSSPVKPKRRYLPHRGVLRK